MEKLLSERKDLRLQGFLPARRVAGTFWRAKK